MIETFFSQTSQLSLNVNLLSPQWVGLEGWLDAPWTTCKHARFCPFPFSILALNINAFFFVNGTCWTTYFQYKHLTHHKDSFTKLMDATLYAQQLKFYAFYQATEWKNNFTLNLEHHQTLTLELHQNSTQTSIHEQWSMWKKNHIHNHGQFLPK